MAKKKPPHERLGAFLVAMKWTREHAAERFGCSPGFVSMLIGGSKLPGRLVANAIERVTAAEWSSGAIRSEEWDAVELARRTGTEG